MSKSDQFRELWDQGYGVAEIARRTGSYYSFVYRVIRRYTGRKPTKRGSLKRDIRELMEQNGRVNVDDVLRELGLGEDRRPQVYKVWKEIRDGLQYRD